MHSANLRSPLAGESASQGHSPQAAGEGRSFRLGRHNIPFAGEYSPLRLATLADSPARGASCIVREGELKELAITIPAKGERRYALAMCVIACTSASLIPGSDWL